MPELKERNELEIQKDEAKEFLTILMSVPEEKRSEVKGIVRGFALYAETEKIGNV